MAGDGPISAGVLYLSQWDLQTLLPTLFLIFSLSTSIALASLGLLSESRIAFAATLWVIAYSLSTTLHRRYQAQHRGLSPRLLWLRGAATGRLLYSELYNRKGIDLGLYLLLFAAGSSSAVVWWPSIPILSLAYCLTLYVDRRVLPITTSGRPADIFERLWLILLILQPVGNLPMALQWLSDSDPLGMILLAAAFWGLQLILLAFLLHLQWRTGSSRPPLPLAS